MNTRALLLTTVFVAFITSCNKREKVTVVSPIKNSIGSIVSGVTSGKVEAEQHSVLSFGAVGRINQVSVSLGSQVKRGEILASLENADLKAALDQAEREFRRVEKLKNEMVLSSKELEAATEQRDMALGAYEKSLIRAPFDGIITEKNIEVGQLSQITAVNPIAPLRIVDSIPRYVVVSMDEVDLPRIHIGQNASVKILAHKKEAMPGIVRKVISYVSTAREQDRTIQVEIDIPKQEALLPVGASADVDVVVEVKDDALTLPTKSVLGRIGARFVYSVSDNRIVRIPVVTGISNLDQTEILSGVTLDSQVVFNTESREIKEGLPVSTVSRHAP